MEAAGIGVQARHVDLGMDRIGQKGVAQAEKDVHRVPGRPAVPPRKGRPSSAGNKSASGQRRARLPFAMRHHKGRLLPHIVVFS